MDEIIIEKWLTFTLIDGKWDIQLWADSAKVYRLRVKVPAELVGRNRQSETKKGNLPPSQDGPSPHSDYNYQCTNPSKGHAGKLHVGLSEGPEPLIEPRLGCSLIKTD